jgi:hypothetical protein
MVVIAFAEVDRAHAAASNLTDESIGANPLVWRRPGSGRCVRVLLQSANQAGGNLVYGSIEKGIGCLGCTKEFG